MRLELTDVQLERIIRALGTQERDSHSCADNMHERGNQGASNAYRTEATSCSRLAFELRSQRGGNTWAS
jgi:hypothetical protein